MTKKEKKHGVVLSLSGGLDSSTLLLKCINEYENVVALSFDYGQKHKIELQKAKDLVHYLNWGSIEDEKFNQIMHQVIKLDGLENLLVSGLMNNGSMNMIKGHYADETAKSTVVPNRNAIFASITYAIALSQVKSTGKECDIALGTHMGDFDNNKKEGIYPDCSEEFRSALEYAFKIGNWDSDKVNYYAPFNSIDKNEVLKEGLRLCEELNLNYKEIYSRTMTSYDPKYMDGEWYSDMNSGSSIERIISFIKAGVPDPLQYVDDNGNKVSWDIVKNNAIKIENDFRKK